MPTSNSPAKVVDVAVALICKQVANMSSTSGMDPFPHHEILITKRKANTPYEGYWEFPGGKLDPGESPEGCARRECMEEMGVSIRVLSVLTEVVHTYEHATVRLFPCVCALEPESPEPRAIEVADCRWCALDGLPWEAFLPANVRLVTALHRYLTRACA